MEKTINIYCFDFRSRESMGHKADHRFHRKCNHLNIADDRVYPIMHPIIKNYRLAEEELPARKPHFKV